MYNTLLKDRDESREAAANVYFCSICLISCNSEKSYVRHTKGDYHRKEAAKLSSSPRLVQCIKHEDVANVSWKILFPFLVCPFPVRNSVPSVHSTSNHLHIRHTAFVCPSIYSSIRSSVRPSIHLFVRLSVSGAPSLRNSVSSVHPSVCSSARPFDFPTVSPSNLPSIYICFFH